MKEIPLTQGRFTQVDDWNYDWLNQWNWTAHKSRNTYYAERTIYFPHKKTIFMHRLILDTPTNQKTDHQDHDGLNNQEFNIRNATGSQNAMNQKPHSSTGYLGVYKEKNNHFRAFIRVNKKGISLGSFNSPMDAAKARDIASLKYFGEFANLNFK